MLRRYLHSQLFPSGTGYTHSMRCSCGRNLHSDTIALTGKPHGVAIQQLRRSSYTAGPAIVQPARYNAVRITQYRGNGSLPARYLTSHTSPDIFEKDRTICPNRAFLAAGTGDYHTFSFEMCAAFCHRTDSIFSIPMSLRLGATGNTLLLVRAGLPPLCFSIPFRNSPALRSEMLNKMKAFGWQAVCHVANRLRTP